MSELIDVSGSVAESVLTRLPIVEFSDMVFVLRFMFVGGSFTGVTVIVSVPVLSERLPSETV